MQPHGVNPDPLLQYAWRSHRRLVTASRGIQQSCPPDASLIVPGENGGPAVAASTSWDRSDVWKRQGGGWPAEAIAGSHCVSGVGDQFEYLGRPGGERGVGGVELDGFAGVDALSHPPLGLRPDHAVLGRDLVPAWLGLPGRLPGEIVEAPTGGWPLACCHDQRLGVVEV